MEEAAIRPRYTVPTETDGTLADYSAIEAAVNAHNQNAQPGEAYWGIRLYGAEYEVYEYGEVPQPPTAEELAAQEAAQQKAAAKQKAVDTLPETLAALQSAQTDTDSLVVDQEYRLTMLELGVTPEE